MVEKVASDFICYLEAVSGLPGSGLAVAAKSGDFLLLFDPKGAGGQYESARIDDRKGSGFYIRLKDGTVEEAPQLSKRGSCERSSYVKAACRLVAYSNQFDVRQMYEVFRPAITAYTRASIGANAQQVQADVRRTNFDFTSIVIDESTPQEREGMTGFEGMLNLLSIDFDLTYIHENCGTVTKPLC